MASCPSCRRGVPDVAIFCPRCGQRVSDWPEITNAPASVSPPPLPPRPPAPPFVRTEYFHVEYPHVPPLPRGPYDPMLLRKAPLSLPAIIIIVIAVMIIVAMCFGVMVG